MIERCTWREDGEGRYFMPHCHGGVVHGPEGCFCADYTAPVQLRISNLRAECEAWQERCERRDHEIRALRRRLVKVRDELGAEVRRLRQLAPCKHCDSGAQLPRLGCASCGRRARLLRPPFLEGQP